MSVGFIIKRLDGETWRACVERISKEALMKHECLGWFDDEVSRGVPEDRAAFKALYEWDCCPIGKVPDEVGEAFRKDLV